MNHYFRRWITLGILALAISGIYSVLLVALRAPVVSALVNKELFRTALVVHVDLSVLVWLLSMISGMWCLSISVRYIYWAKYSLYVSFFGTLLIAISPVTGDASPVMNNYIPMLENWCFITGVVIFFCGVIINAILLLVSKRNDTLYYANSSSALVVIISVMCFVLSYVSLDKLLYPLDLHFFYETLFWSGGHMLQFAYVSGAMLAWIILLEKYLSKKLESNIMYNAIFVVNVLLTIPALFVHFIYKIDHPDFVLFFTEHMKYCGGIAPVLLFFVISLDLISNTSSSPWKIAHSTMNAASRNAFFCSVVLFASGGVIGFLISGVNVTIPAHYHGMVVGISMTFMAISYVYLWQDLDVLPKIAIIQPYVYSIGQIMHISGLAWSGGYGVLRKTPGAELSVQAKISMGVMGFGGLIAIIGGLMFVYVCWRKVSSTRYSINHRKLSA